jgi:hypothetical protein
MKLLRKLFQRELSVHEMRAVIGETLAHLEYLFHNGDCKKECKNNVCRYLKA